MSEAEIAATAAEKAANPGALRAKGLVLAVAGAAAVAMNYVTAKHAMRGMNFATFMTLWYSAAWAYSALYITVSRKPWKQQFRSLWKPLVLIGLCHGLCGLASFAGLKMLDPTVAAFVSRSSVLFGVLLGLVVLRERPSRLGWLGMAIATAGIVVLTYATGHAERSGIALTLAGALLASLGLMVGKYIVGGSSSTLIVCVRGATVALLAATYTFGTGQFDTSLSVSHLAVLLVGAFFGPFLSQMLFFRALGAISLSEVSVILATTPVYVAIYSLVFLSMFPGPRQLVGGLIVLGGIVLLARARPVRQELAGESAHETSDAVLVGAVAEGNSPEENADE